MHQVFDRETYKEWQFMLQNKLIQYVDSYKGRKVFLESFRQVALENIDNQDAFLERLAEIVIFDTANGSNEFWGKTVANVARNLVYVQGKL